MQFCSFSSGSNGNCYYIGTPTTSILVDAGIGIRAVKKRLKAIGVDMLRLHGVFVTHDHFDHTAAVGVLASSDYNIPVYATAKIIDGINRSYKTTHKIYNNRRDFEIGEVIEVGDLSITSFYQEHDSSQCVGYYIESADSSLVIATDLGKITPEVAHYLKKAKNVVVEANYDENMLLTGRYAEFLKKRILSASGHLANHVTCRFIVENEQAHWQRVFFCHLSANNNSPECLMQCLNNAYLEAGRSPHPQIEFMPLPRRTSTEVYEL